MVSLDDAVKNLGSTKDELVQILIDNEITGVMGDGYHCPVAQYLNKQIGGILVLAVTNFAIKTKVGQIITPPHVSEFIQEFDNGKYPNMCD